MTSRVDPYAVNTLEHAGIMHMQQGDLDSAEVALLDALTKRSSAFPDDPDHQSLAGSLNNLAVLHLKQRRLDEAAAGFSRVVAISEVEQQRRPTARMALEIDSAKRNLATAQRLASQEAAEAAAVSMQTAIAAAAAAPVQLDDPALLPATSSAVNGGAAAWAALRGVRGTDVLRTTARKNKDLIAKKLGIDAVGMRETDVDDAIRRAVSSRSAAGGPGRPMSAGGRPTSAGGVDVDLETMRAAIGTAFDLLDEDGDGSLSRLEVLRGLKSKGQVRELLQMGPLTDPSEFDAVYRAIDADGSNTVDRKEFEAYFMRHLAPPAAPAHPPASPYGPPPPATASGLMPQAAEAARELDARRAAGAALRFVEAGKAAAQHRAVEAALAEAGSRVPGGSSASRAALAGSAGRHSSALFNSEASDLAAYDEVSRSLELSQRRKVGLQQDIEALQREMRAVDADIIEKGALAERLRATL